MPRLQLRFYQELNDFLPRRLRGRRFEHQVIGRASVKDVVESLGVPHTEIDLVLVNGDPVDFAYRIQADGDISVFPVFESLYLSSASRLRPRPLRQPRFIADVHLGRLSAYLRLMGLDCLYEPEWDDARQAQVAAGQGRILLTRDRGLLKRRIVSRGYCPRDGNPRRQLIEVLRRFDLLDQCRPFTRCLRCNGTLAALERSQAQSRLPAAAAASATVFAACAGCGRVYWNGSHYDRMQALVDHVRSVLAKQPGS